jgi:hypothetical protein
MTYEEYSTGNPLKSGVIGGRPSGLVKQKVALKDKKT